MPYSITAREEQAELEKRVAALQTQVEKLNTQLAKARAIDISHYAVSMPTKVTYNSKGARPAVKVSGLASSAYSVTYYKYNKVGQAYVIIKARGGSYTGKITKYYRIVPKKAAVLKIKKGKKKMTVTAKTKVSATGGTTYQIRYRVKGKAKWKTKTTKNKKITIKKLKKGKKYQVQIRACAKVGGKTYYGAWSKKKTTPKIR